MNTHHLRLAVVLSVALVPGVARAQHEGHQAGAPQPSPEMAQCARVQPAIDHIISGAMARLESSRTSNNPAEMRAAVDELGAALRDVRAQLAPCAKLIPAADPHAGHTSGQHSDKQIDPVNGLMVDSATSPKATYQGQTYYFSSEQTRKEFLNNPAKFTKKPNE